MSYSDPNEQFNSPEERLEQIRRKLERVAQDYADGQLNRAQFNAIYSHYNEQRSLVEKLIARNPGNDAWKQAASPGNTGFLRSHFEARVVHVAVFRHHNPTPLMTGGEDTDGVNTAISTVLRALWRDDRPLTTGLARKQLDDEQWLVIAVGPQGVTTAVFSLQPSVRQHSLIRDQHHDFERANKLALARNYPVDRMVFPQRALLGRQQ